VYSALYIVCYTGPHFFWAYCVALPGIIVWGIGIPLFAYFLLTADRKKLDTLEVKEKFGFLYRGYKKEFYYWEVVIMYRKIMMVVIAVVLQTYGVITQVCNFKLYMIHLIGTGSILAFDNFYCC
jgi:hypothetical protein